MNSLRLIALGLMIGLAGLPGSAKVLAEGKPAKGYYWQKIENNAKKISYMCRLKTATGSTLEKAGSCDKAGAVRPQ
jgi:hypothetical protein